MKTFALVIFLVIKAFSGSGCRPENISVLPECTVTVTATDPVHHQPFVHVLNCGYAEESSEDKEGAKNTADRKIPSVVKLYPVVINLSLNSAGLDSFFRSASYHILYNNLRL